MSTLERIMRPTKSGQTAARGRPSRPHGRPNRRRQKPGMLATLASTIVQRKTTRAGGNTGKRGGMFDALSARAAAVTRRRGK